jgi:hypothetical protein
MKSKLITMNAKKMIIAGLLGGVAYFFLGWLVWGILLMDIITYPEDMVQVILIPEEEMRISFMIISCLAYGLFMAYIFNKWASISTFKTGAQAGAMIGAAFSIIVGTSMHSMYTFTSIPNIAFDTLANLVTSAIVGGIVGWYLGR